MSLPVLFDHFGCAVAALSGVLAARGKNLDLFGVLVLAVVTAFGGGSLRDVLLGGGAAWLRAPEFFTTVCLTAVVSFIVCHRWEPPAALLLVADALALGFFAVVGTRKGLAQGFAPSVSIALGVITGVAGGIMRDTLTGRVPLVFRQDTYFYATAASFGGLVYWLLSTWLSDDAATWIAVASCIALRLGAIRYRLRLPVFQPRNIA